MTGDIDAMWLRDSTNQILPYLEFVKQDEHLAQLFKLVVQRQAKYVATDPYANAFNKEMGEQVSEWGGGE